MISTLTKLTGFAITFMTVTAASAAPQGKLSISSIVGGGVNISASRIDFYLPSNTAGSPGVGDASNGGLTNISYANGVLTAATNPYVQLKDIDAGVGPIMNFIQFYISPAVPVPGIGPVQVSPVFDLVGFIAGGANQGALNNCTGVTSVGVSCSPLLTVNGNSFVSPLVLTNRGAYTEVSFAANLNARDSNGTTPFFGGFTSQVTSQLIDQQEVRLTPAVIQTLLNNGGLISGTWSATVSSATGGSSQPPPPSSTTPSAADQCKNGGWTSLVRADGTHFKNQGDCIQYVNTGK